MYTNTELTYYYILLTTYHSTKPPEANTAMDISLENVKNDGLKCNPFCYFTVKVKLYTNFQASSDK